MNGIAGEFHAIGNFPSVIGVIDGTHMRILAPKEEEWSFVNRKNEHTMNVQVNNILGKIDKRRHNFD